MIDPCETEVAKTAEEFSALKTEVEKMDETMQLK
jgi:hypothetical protein